MKINPSALGLAMADARLMDRELCQLSGVAIPTFAKIKHGRLNARPATVGKLAYALNVPVTELLLKPGEEPVYDAPQRGRKTPTTEGPVLTAKDVARELKISLASAYKEMAKPEFPYFEIGSQKRVSVEAFREYIKQKANGAR